MLLSIREIPFNFAVLVVAPEAAEVLPLDKRAQRNLCTDNGEIINHFANSEPYHFIANRGFITQLLPGTSIYCFLAAMRP